MSDAHTAKPFWVNKNVIYVSTYINMYIYDTVDGRILHHLGCTKPRVNNGIDCQPQLVSRISSINSMYILIYLYIYLYISIYVYIYKYDIYIYTYIPISLAWSVTSLQDASSILTTDRLQRFKWGFHCCHMIFVQEIHMGVSKNKGTPKWMVYNGKSY